MRTSKNKKEVTSNVHSYCYAIILLTYVQLLTNLYKSSAAAEMDATAYLFMMNPWIQYSEVLPQQTRNIALAFMWKYFDITKYLAQLTSVMDRHFYSTCHANTLSGLKIGPI